jgi:hypothetical protein
VAGGGGYHVENTVRGWALAWRTFSGDNEEYDFGFGMGGVMLGSSEWAGGLRDCVRPVTIEQRQAVEPELRTTLESVVRNLSMINRTPTPSAHGLTAQAGCARSP